MSALCQTDGNAMHVSKEEKQKKMLTETLE